MGESEAMETITVSRTKKQKIFYLFKELIFRKVGDDMKSLSEYHEKSKTGSYKILPLINLIIDICTHKFQDG
jgi:hypothetical protein